MQSNRKKIAKEMKKISEATAQKIATAQNAINNFFTGDSSFHEEFNGPEDLQKAIFRRQQIIMV